MNTPAQFVGLVSDELGLPLTEDHLPLALHEIPGWDSVYLLWLVTVIERESGRQISVADLLDAPNLAYVYDLAANE